MLTKIVIEANRLLKEKLDGKGCQKSKIYNKLDSSFRMQSGGEGSGLYGEDAKSRYTGLNQFIQQIKNMLTLAPEKWRKMDDSQRLSIRLSPNSLLAINIFSILGIDFDSFMQEVRARLDLPEEEKDMEETEYSLILDKLDELSLLLQDQRKPTKTLQERIIFIRFASGAIYNILNQNDTIAVDDYKLQFLIYFIRDLEKYTPKQVLSKRILKELKPNDEGETRVQVCLYLTYLLIVNMIDILEKIDSAQKTTKRHEDNLNHNLLLNFIPGAEKLKQIPQDMLPDMLKQKPISKAFIKIVASKLPQDITEAFFKLEKEHCSFLSFLEDFKSKNEKGETITSAFPILENQEKKGLICILKDLSQEVSKFFGKPTPNLARNYLKQELNLQTLLKQQNLFDYSFDIPETTIKSLNDFVEKAKTIYADIRSRIKSEFTFKEPYTLSPIQEQAKHFIFSKWKTKLAKGQVATPVIALDMGMGKTVVACSAIKQFIEKQGDALRYILVIVPASLIANWVNTLHEYKVGKVIELGQQRKRYIVNGKLHTAEAQVFVTSYDMANSDHELYMENPPDLIVYDELQTANTVDILDKCRNLAKLNSLVKHKFALTGTPVQNNTGEFFVNYCFFHDPLLLEKARQFMGKKDNDFEWEAEETKAVKQILSEKGFYFFGQAATEKGISIKYVPLKIGKKQLDNYKTLEKEKVADQTIAQYLICPQSLKDTDEHKVFGIDVEIESAKMKFVRQLVKEIPNGEKLIIFSYYKKPLEYLYRELFGYSPSLVLGSKTNQEESDITGSLSSNNRRELERFKNDENCRILLSTVKKSGIGENLEVANHLVILDLWWNPMVIIQAMHRIIRRNQEKDMHIYIPVYAEITHTDYDAETTKIMECETKVVNTMRKKVDNYNNFLAGIKQTDGIREFPAESLGKILDFNRKPDEEFWLLKELQTDDLIELPNTKFCVERQGNIYNLKCITSG